MPKKLFSSSNQPAKRRGENGQFIPRPRISAGAGQFIVPFEHALASARPLQRNDKFIGPSLSLIYPPQDELFQDELFVVRHGATLQDFHEARGYELVMKELPPKGERKHPAAQDVRITQTFRRARKARLARIAERRALRIVYEVFWPTTVEGRPARGRADTPPKRYKPDPNVLDKRRPLADNRLF